MLCPPADRTGHRSAGRFELPSGEPVKPVAYPGQKNQARERTESGIETEARRTQRRDTVAPEEGDGAVGNRAADIDSPDDHATAPEDLSSVTTS